MRYAAILFFFLTLLMPEGYSQEKQTVAREYDLKAAYIYNITKFIYWDSSTPGNDFVIGVLGSSPVYEPLVDAVRSKTVMNKKIIVRQYYTVEEINNSDMIFLSQNADILLDELLEKARRNKILIISEQEGYSRLGTAINFVTIENKLKFEVNIHSLESIGLKASAQFLKLVIIIDE